LEDVGVDGRIILTCILKKKFWRVWTGLLWLSIDTYDQLQEGSVSEEPCKQGSGS
jgi:hypothetical protein